MRVLQFAFLISNVCVCLLLTTIFFLLLIFFHVLPGCLDDDDVIVGGDGVRMRRNHRSGTEDGVGEDDIERALRLSMEEGM